MKLQKWRWLALLTCIVILLASASYVISYQTFIETEKQGAQDRAKHYHSLLVGMLNQHKPLLRVLTEDPGVMGALSLTQSGSNQHNQLNQLSQRLERYAKFSGLEAIYLMDREGVTRATSNYQQHPRLSFMNKNYGFRPYFKTAIKGEEGSYFAVGATTGLPGYFISSPVLSLSGQVIGVLAAKIDAAMLSVIWQSTEDLGFITNDTGVIILASNPAWLYQTITALTAQQINRIRLQKQFSGQRLMPLSWSPVDDLFVTVETKDYLYTPHEIGTSGWVLHLLSDPATVKKNAAFVALVVSALSLFLLSWGLTIRSRTIKQSLLKSELNRGKLIQMNDNLEAEIGERHRAEKRLSLAQKELVQANRMAALGQLSAAVIHELGQPLAAFKNYITAAEMDPDGEDMRLLLANLDSVALRMQSTTSQLRFFSRPDETKFALVDLHQVVASAIELTRAQCDHAKVDLKWSPSIPNQALVMGQSLRLEQVIVNLLINAFAAVNEGGQVLVSLELEQDNWLLRVADNGAGFGTQDLEELFQAFYTTKASTDGMGLGLAISASIVNEHHGQIWAQNSTLNGAEFVVTIPRAV
jgi:two-component system C4-dicarboxylate transport sensor histidine kinase DctB